MQNNFCVVQISGILLLQVHFYVRKSFELAFKNSLFHM